MVTVRLELQARKGKATVRQELEPGRGLLEKSWSQGGSNFLAYPGQDPGYSNRGGATSHTHMRAWLRFILLLLPPPLCTMTTVQPSHRITGEKQKKINTPGFESEI